ncbi:hypothetical protein IC229_28115 [Spirosoma sp. BT702]|uniref:Uncharacterized protein n=1 Tax=Spirosoma profusum TaxID=2771354 RepID=A0A926Y0T0_9BACT|nr:hypothetical protein [Spirosoma profusum]MBD2704539.1 hypothetical protein [Spirosoma profusum]
MTKFFRFLQTIDLIRLVVGICMLLDGYPIIFFFRDTLHLAPNSTAFTAAGFAGGLVLMVPFTFLQRLYRPNVMMLTLLIGFLAMSIFYMFFFNGNPHFEDYNKDLIYYAYVLIFMFLLINIPNDIIRVFIPVVVFFTLVSNMALLYSLITDPTWTVGQRATISLGDNDDGSGNPHVFARNAFMGIVACGIWIMRPNTHILFRLLSFFSGSFSLAILILTQTRSSIVGLILAVICFLYFNARPAQIRSTVRSLLKPIPITIMLVGVVSIIVFFQRNYDTYAVLYGYVIGFMERNMDNIYALLGMKAQGADYSAVLDESAANRSTSAGFFYIVITGHLHMLILGYGYKYFYLDIPMVESLIDQGFFGFLLFGGMNAMAMYYSYHIMRTNPNPLSVFLAYFYTLIFVLVFTGGRPYEITFLFPLAMMTRFMGQEHLFPAYLVDHPEENSDAYLVVQEEMVASTG